MIHEAIVHCIGQTPLVYIIIPIEKWPYPFPRPSLYNQLSHHNGG
jgi:hypothetical protein